MGTTNRKFWLASIAIFMAWGATAAELYQKKATFAETMVSVQDTYRKAVAAGEIHEVVLGDWYISSRFLGRGFNKTHIDVNKVDINAKGQNNKKLWKRHKLFDGVVYTFPGNEVGTTYMYRTLTSDAAQSLPLSFGSDDGIEVWLNGKRYISHEIGRAALADQEKAVFKLNKGVNHLVMKIVNTGGNSGFYFSKKGGEVPALVSKIVADFPACGALLRVDFGISNLTKWLGNDSSAAKVEKSVLENVLKKYRKSGEHFFATYSKATRVERIATLLKASEFRNKYEAVKSSFSLFDAPALERAIDDLLDVYDEDYPNGAIYKAKLKEYVAKLSTVKEGVELGDISSLDLAAEMVDFKRKVLLSNPVLDFDKIMLVKRAAKTSNWGLPWNWQGNTSLTRTHYNDELCTLSLKDLNAPLKRIYKPKKDVFVGDVDLNWDADKVVFSSQDEKYRWQIFEANIDGSGVHQVTTGRAADEESYDPCYLPDGRILYDSTSGFQGVPCVTGGDYVGNLHIMDTKGENVRRLTFDQDNSWCPTVMADGRIMYLRWEYTDSAHYFSRILMQMNPDGTGQREYYGSNSYWPNSMFYARPIPGKPSQFCAIVTGHHGVRREGELVIFDTAKGRREDIGAVQRIPGFGKKVVGPVKDNLIGNVWPRFLHPYPLNENYFLVSCRLSAESNVGIYLVDRFDNMLLLREEPGFVLFEPIPLKKNKRPQIIPDKVRPKSKTGNIFITDIYEGPGLRDVPKGTVKKLRVFQYEYAYRNMGGHYAVGFEGGWDVRRMLGTVDVYEDGSTSFTVPANVPISVQPLDKDGCALQIMRSWLTVMPGETLACIGCHESQNSVVAVKHTIASGKEPMKLTPWYGPVRGFSFNREVQPVLDQYCAGCHNAKHPRTVIDLSRKDEKDWIQVRGAARYSPSYLALHPYIRRTGPEGVWYVRNPGEFHANTSELYQILKKGHHGVKLPKEAMDRLVTWSDINVPFHGTWNEAGNIRKNFAQRRQEMLKKYAGVNENAEEVLDVFKGRDTSFVKPVRPAKIRPQDTSAPGWPFDAAKAKSLQAKNGTNEMTFDLGKGVKMTFVRIPAGEYLMGSSKGARDEKLVNRVKIKKAFWMAMTETTLAQYQAFDANFKNGFYDMHYKDQVRQGYNMDTDKQFPVIRMSFDNSMAFCKWLSDKIGKKVNLPSEGQWEWACRAGSSSDLWFGSKKSDFGKFANLADISLKQMAVQGVDPKPMANPPKYWDFLPKITSVNDGVLHLAKVGSYQPNPWGLYDMHGNVAEWTRSNYRPYPFVDNVNDSVSAGDKVVRGGSWYDRPYRATSSYRLPFPRWQKVYNTGFRVIIEE